MYGSKNIYLNKGNNLCSVKGNTIERQDDKQIKKIIIDFKQVNNVGE